MVAYSERWRCRECDTDLPAPWLTTSPAAGAIRDDHEKESPHEARAVAECRSEAFTLSSHISLHDGERSERLAMPSRIAPAFRRTMRHFEPAGASMTFPLSVTASRARKWASTSLARTGRTRSLPLRAGANHRHRMPPGRPLLVVGERSPMAICKGCPGGLRAAHDRPRWPSRAGGLLSPRISEIRPTTRAYRISSRNSRYSTSNRRRFAHA